MPTVDESAPRSSRFDFPPIAASAFRHCFVAQLTAAAKALDIELDWYSQHWIAQLRKAGEQRHIIGYTFPVNSAVAAHLAADKAAASTLLDRAAVPHVHHHLLRYGSGEQLERDAIALLDEVPLPLVVKPCTGSGGRDVIRVATIPEYLATVAYLGPTHRAVAVSPWVPVRREYRVVRLSGHTELIFEKVLRPGADLTGDGWRHNLKHGAEPVVRTAPELAGPLGALAGAAMTALGIAFASVDVVESDAGYQVIEINGGVSLERFSRAREEHFQLAGEVYRNAVRACFTG